MSENKSTSGGIGFCGLLTIVFIALKLLGKITWSWVWVLAPSWIPAVIGLIIVSVVMMSIGIVGSTGYIASKMKRRK